MDSVTRSPSKLSVKKALQLTVSLLISGGALWWALSELQWKVVGERLHTIHLWALLPATAVFVVHFILRTIRWELLLPETHPKPPRRLLFDSIFVGNFATYVLPLRAGEFVRPAMLSMQSSHRFGTCFVSVVLERFFDLSMVLLSFLPVAFLLPGLPDWAFNGVMVLSVMAGGILLFLLLGVLLPDHLRRLVKSAASLVEHPVVAALERFALSLVDGTAVLGSLPRLLMVVVLTMLIWGSCYLQFYSWFFLFDSTWPPLLSVALGVIVALAVAAPSAPGFIGVYQIGCSAAFALFPGMLKEDAAAYSLVTHAYQYVFVCGYGAFALLRNHVKLNELTGANPVEETATVSV